MKLTHLPGLAVAAILTLALSVPAFGAMEGWEKALYEKAKQEGEFTWYTSHYNSETAAAVCDGFMKKYPGIQCNFVRQTAQVTYQRFLQDQKAGLAVASLLGTTDMGHWVRLKKTGALMPYKPNSRGKVVEVMRRHSDADGYYWITSAGLVVINYHSEMVSAAEAPKSWQDLLDPKWKGKVALGHPGFSGYVGTWTVMMRKLYGWDYFEQMEKNDPQIGRSINDTVTMINARERQVGAGPDATTLKSADKGNPIAVSYPKDGALLMVAPSGIPKNAPAPNSGKLLLEFLYSIENSEIQVKLRGLSLRPEVKQLPGQKSLAEIKTIRPTFEEIVNGIPEVKEDFRDTFGI